MTPFERFHHAPRDGDSWCECPGCGSTEVDLLLGHRNHNDEIHPRRVKFECHACGRDSPAESTRREFYSTPDAINRHIDETVCSPAAIFEPNPEEYAEEGGDGR